MCVWREGVVEQHFIIIYYNKKHTIAFSKTYKCIFDHSEEHNGPPRDRNTTTLTSETMWSQPILIDILTVLVLL